MKNLEFEELSQEEIKQIEGGNPAILGIIGLIVFVGAIIYGHLKED